MCECRGGVAPLSQGVLTGREVQDGSAASAQDSMVLVCSHRRTVRHASGSAVLSFTGWWPRAIATDGNERESRKDWSVLAVAQVARVMHLTTRGVGVSYRDVCRRTFTSGASLCGPPEAGLSQATLRRMIAGSSERCLCAVDTSTTRAYASSYSHLTCVFTPNGARQGQTSSGLRDKF